MDRVECRRGALAPENGEVPLDLERIKKEQQEDAVIETVRQWMVDEGEQGWSRAQGTPWLYSNCGASERL